MSTAHIFFFIHPKEEVQIRVVLLYSLSDLALWKKYELPYHFNYWLNSIPDALLKG